MKTDRFTMQSSLEANYLNIKLEEEEQLDRIAVRVIKDDCPEFLIPFRMLELNNAVTLKYKLVNAVSFAYTGLTLPKQTFVQIYLNLLTPFIKGKDWFLDYHSLCIDPRYVYLDKHTNQVFFIYLPIHSDKNTDQEIMEFFRNLFLSVVITDDKDFEIRLHRFFGSEQKTLDGLYRILTESQGNKNKAVQQIVTSSAIPKTVSEKSFNERQEKAESADDPVKKEVKEEKNDLFSGEDEVMAALFGGGAKAKETKTKKPLKEKKQKKEKQVKAKKPGMFASLLGGKKKEEAAEQMAVPPEQGGMAEIPVPQKPTQEYHRNYPVMTMEDNTQIEEESNDFGNPWLELLDLDKGGAMNRIELVFSKPYLIMGRMSADEIQPDIAFPKEFKRIGRQHLRFEKHDGRIVVIDLGSVNRSMLNGEILAPNYPYELQDGMILALNVNHPLRYRVHI